jgi:hypothetical protein
VRTGRSRYRHRAALGMKLSKEASVGGLLLFGTTTSSFAKLGWISAVGRGRGAHSSPTACGAVYELKSVGLHGESKNFRKPWAMTAIMFLGMSLCLPFAYQPDEKQEVSVLGTSLSTGRSPTEVRPAHRVGCIICAGRQGARRMRVGAHSSMLIPVPCIICRPFSTLSPSGQVSCRLPQELLRSLVIAVPAGFDLVATVLMNVGLLSVTASVYQMLRGACMLFAAVFAVTFLKRSLNGLHFTGIGCAIVRPPPAATLAPPQQAQSHACAPCLAHIQPCMSAQQALDPARLAPAALPQLVAPSDIVTFIALTASQWCARDNGTACAPQAGIALVGLSSLLASGDGVGAAADMADSSTVLMGMALIVLSQVRPAGLLACRLSCSGGGMCWQRCPLLQPSVRRL